jgi:hypothetical protein
MQLARMCLLVAMAVSGCAHHTPTQLVASQPNRPITLPAPGEVDLSRHRRLDLDAFFAPTSNGFELWPGGQVVRHKRPGGLYAYATISDLKWFAELPAQCVPAGDARLFECGDAVRDRDGAVLVDGPRTSSEGFLTRAVVEGGRWVVFGTRTWTVFDRSGALGQVPTPKAADVAGRRLTFDGHAVKYHGSNDALVFDTATIQMTHIPHGTPWMQAAGGALRGEGVMRSADGGITTWKQVDQSGVIFDEVNHGERAWRCPRERAMRPCLQVVATHTGEVLVMQRDARHRLEIWRTDGTRFGALDGLQPNTTVTLSDDGRHLVMPVSGGLEIAALDTLQPTLLLAGHRTGTVRFDTLTGHSRLVSCDGAGMAVLWEREGPTPVRHLGFPGCEGLAFSRSGSRFIAGRTIFDADGTALTHLPDAHATTLSLDGTLSYTLGYAEGATFAERRVVLQAFRVDDAQAPMWRVILPQRRLLDPGLAVVAGPNGDEQLVVGTGDALLVVDPDDGKIMRTVAGVSPSAPMAVWDRSGVALAFGTAGNRVQLVSVAADGWKTRTVAPWTLVDNALPLHVPAHMPGDGWLIPGDTMLHLTKPGGPIPLGETGARGAGAVSAVPLDATRWLVGMRNGALRIIDGGIR